MTKTNYERLEIKLAPGSRTMIDRALDELGYKEVAPFIRDAIREKIAAITGDDLPTLTRGAPKRDQGGPHN